jgi:hypothetical protein
MVALSLSKIVEKRRKKMKKKTLCVVFTSIAVMWVPNWMECSDTVPQSCTIFTASFGDTVLFGNNEDYINPSTYYWVSPSTAGSFETTRFQLEMDFDKGSTATVIQTAEITLEPGTKIIEYELCSEHDISPSPMKSLYRRGRKIIHVDFV